MKKLFMLSLAVSAYACCFSQAHVEKVEYLKTNREAIVNDIPFPEKTVTQALNDTLEKLGYKAKSVKGYQVYQGVKLSQLGPDMYDLYFAIDRKSRKEKETSSVTMIVSKGLDNFVQDATDHKLMQNAVNYLNDLKNTVASYDLEQQIMEQDAVVKKNEKKSSSLVSDAEDLQKKMKKLEEQIAENQKGQSSQQMELQKQKQILDNLKSRRKVS